MCTKLSYSIQHNSVPKGNVRACECQCVQCARALILYLDSFCSVFSFSPFSFRTFTLRLICELNKTAHVLLLLLLLLNINLNFKFCSKFFVLFTRCFAIYLSCIFHVHIKFYFCIRFSSSSSVTRISHLHFTNICSYAIQRYKVFPFIRSLRFSDAQCFSSKQFCTISSEHV